MKKHILVAGCVMALSAPHALAQSETSEPARHVLNLDDVEINDLIEDVSIVTGYTFIVHPDVRSKRVTVMSQTPLSSADVFQVFLSTLRVHGFAAVPAGRNTYKIIPEQSAVGEARIGGSGPNAFVTQIFKLDHFSAIDAAQMIKPLIDAQGQVVAN
ncbi:MAG: type II secretion system protein GspD, partial [Hyphomonadaceae bacterium]